MAAAKKLKAKQAQAEQSEPAPQAPQEDTTDSVAAGVPGPSAEEPALPAVRCPGCGRGFASVEELRAHAVESGASCSAPMWQAAVNAIGCMPGAGTTLWCPACPDSFVGKWTGSVSKASVPECAPKAHAWFLAAFVDLLLSWPPEPAPVWTESAADGEVPAEDPAALEERLQDWISSSPPLLGIVGPLLAKPGPEAREAARQELEGARDFAAGPAPDPFGVGGSAAQQEDREDAAKKKKKGRKAQESEAAGPAYDFYNEDIPLDVFAACEDHTERTADGVPVMDLLDSSDEEGTADKDKPTSSDLTML
eukprot:TRINITY_DN34055_c0_g1_i2.p1 TRINITY_DN34055_c0_g1~~TRINITY_DN34055_c0_g1_i2.p1  ORF type:complete len:353 (-),score=96.14 TRINITY_DN34055_c0_g1_i2:54-977(-)